MNTLYPVYLPKPMIEGESMDDHNADIAKNEENLRQNLARMNDQINSLTEQLSSLRGTEV